MELIDKVLNQLHSEFCWGYAPEYHLSSTSHCTQNYASHYYNKHMLPIDQVSELLGMIAKERRFLLKKLCRKLYRQYNESKTVYGTAVVNDLKVVLEGKKVLIVSTGKSICDAEKKIKGSVAEDDTISFGLNLTNDLGLDYVLTTRSDVYEEAIVKGKNVIVVSSISKGGRGNVKILDDKNWINVD